MVNSEEDVPRFSLRRGARFLDTFPDQTPDEEPGKSWLADLGEEPDEPVAAAVTPELDAEHEANAGGPGEAAGDHPDPDVARHRRFGQGVEQEPGAPVGLPDQMGAFQPRPGEGFGGTDYRKKLEELAAHTAEPPTPPAGTTPAPAPVSRAVLDDAAARLAEHLAVLEEALARTAAACTVARMLLGQGRALSDHPAGSAGVAPPGDQQAVPQGADEGPAVADLRHRSPSPMEPPQPAGHRHGPGSSRPAAETPALTRLITPLRRYGSTTLRDLLRPE